MDEATWNAALVWRGKQAEAKFQRGDVTTPEDIVVMALLHPDKFDIMVTQQEGDRP